MSPSPARSTVCEHADVVQRQGVARRSLAFRHGMVSMPTGDDYRVNLRDHIILPGLINAHDHLQLNAVPPLPHSEPFVDSYEWIAVFESHFADPNIAMAVAIPAATRHWHGGLKNLLSGVTTVAHHDPWAPAFDEPGFPVRVLRKFGWSHSLGLSDGRAGQLRRYGPAVLESCAATPSNEPWIIHLAEGVDDTARAELSQLDALGCLRANTVIVHGVGLEEADIARVTQVGAHVVWCPSSNLGMFGQTLSPRELFDAGLLALGTDSRLTGSRDLLDELAVARAHGDLSARELFSLVTSCASKALRSPSIGGLAMGQRADCLVLRAGNDGHAALLGTRRSDIRAVVRDGSPVIADPDFAPWFDALAIEVVQVQLDGEPKLMARGVARADACALEAGLELLEA